jgi:ribosomal protein S18 acetylase RimI-like enzyme
VNVRRATAEDLAKVQQLWRELSAEVPEPPQYDVVLDEELAQVAGIVEDGLAFLAEEDDGQAVGLALGRKLESRLGRITDHYVVPAARRRGVAAALARDLVAELAARGLEYVDLEVLASNTAARAVYARWGFHESELTLVGRVGEVTARLGQDVAPSWGSIHVQTDDHHKVEHAVRQFVPRLPGRSRGSIVSRPRNGWVAVYDDVADRDPDMLRRLARELSDRLGSVTLAIGAEEDAVVRFVLFDRGRVMDEYLSVQEFYGPLPPGDVIALAANPTVVARLTGAHPADVRAAALHASTPGELPPARELLARLAAVMSIEGAEHGWADAGELEGATRIDRA